VGGHVETSLLEAMVDFQFEVLTTHLNDGGRPPQRARVRNAHAYLGARHGVYRTAGASAAPHVDEHGARIRAEFG
jgi:crotonobetainyl-CoA:carnitine CoA-transferase CaiB-like acyl-CoA transferase